MTISIEDHAAMRLSGRLAQPLECTCDEYACLIVDRAREIEMLKDDLAIYKKMLVKMIGEKNENGDI